MRRAKGAAIHARRRGRTRPVRPAAAPSGAGPASKSISPAMAASVTAATSAPQPHRSASRSITSPCKRVESASSTIRCFARRCRPSTWTAMSTSAPHGFLGQGTPQAGPGSLPPRRTHSCARGRRRAARSARCFPGTRAIRAQTPSSVDAAISGARTVTRNLSCSERSSASSSGAMATSTSPDGNWSAIARRRCSPTSSGAPSYLHAEQQPSVNPNLLDVADIDTVSAQNGEETLRRCPVRPAR